MACRLTSCTPMKCNDGSVLPEGDQGDVAGRETPAATSAQLRLSEWHRGGLLERRGGYLYAVAPLSGERLWAVPFSLRNVRADDPHYGNRSG